MDAEGFVFVSVIAVFNRMSKLRGFLTLREMIDGLAQSELEVKFIAPACPAQSPDDVELAKVRVKGSWRQWLPPAAR